MASTVALVALYVGTPVGGLAERGVRLLLGLPPPRISLSDYFDVGAAPRRNRLTATALPTGALAERHAQDAAVERLARETVPGDLARAFAMVASGGVVALDARRRPWYDVRSLPHHGADRAALGLAPFPVAVGQDASPAVEPAPSLGERLRSHLELLAAYRQALGGTDAALAAWLVGLDLSRRAVERARLAGASRPAALEAFEPYLSSAEAERVRAFVSAVQVLRLAYGMGWPVDGRFAVSSGFGMRLHPILGRRKHHDGVDLAAPEGEPIRAVADGVVRFAGADGINGLYLKLDHGYGLATAYCHARRLLVRRGDRVEKGQVVAEVGASGRATGPHLHYGVFVAGQPVDPLIFRPPDSLLR